MAPFFASPETCSPAARSRSVARSSVVGFAGFSGATRANASNAGAIFVGPFTTDDWPSRDFKAMLAIFKPGDALRERWIEQVGLTEVDRFALPQDYEGRLYRMEDGWVTLER